MFVDYWWPSKKYEEKAAEGSDDRDAYYQAIVEFIERQVDADHGGEPQPHRRIIQFREGDTVDSLHDDDAYYNHLCKCEEFGKADPAATDIAMVDALFHGHFAIIDGKRVVQLLMKFQKDGPPRYAAVIYHDERGKLVERYMAMVTLLMSSRRTSFEREIGGGEPSSAA